MFSEMNPVSFEVVKTTRELYDEKCYEIENILRSLNIHKKAGKYIYTPEKITYNIKFNSLPINEPGWTTPLLQYMENVKETEEYNEKLMKKALNFDSACYKLKIGQVNFERNNSKTQIYDMCISNYKNYINGSIKEIVNIIKKIILKNVGTLSHFAIVKYDEETFNSVFVPVFEYFKNKETNTIEIDNNNETNKNCFDEIRRINNEKLSKKQEDERIKNNLKQFQGLWDENDL